MKQTLLFFYILLNACLYGQKHSDLSASFDIEKSAIVELSKAPQEESSFTASQKGSIIILNDPEGRPISFQCYENTTMSEEMKTAFPSIRSYTGYAGENKSSVASITTFNGKITARIHKNNEPLIEINFDQESQSYVSTYHYNVGDHYCGLGESHTLRQQINADRGFMPQNGSTLKTFRMALVITPTFVNNFGGGDSTAAVNVLTTIMTDINIVYRNTLAISFTISPRIDYSNIYIVPLDMNGLPIPSATKAAMTVNSYFSAGQYDIGHLFDYRPIYMGSYSGSGVAGVGACNNSTKANGVSTGTTASLLYDIAIHEIGHQFGAGHTLSGTQGNCAGSFNRNSSVEPGSGTTIMSYSEVCANDNITDQSGFVLPGNNTYFHAWSIKQMLEYINSQTCFSTSGVVNNPPLATANPCGVTTFSIPKSTPFELTGSASDADNDNLLYQWDQVDTMLNTGGIIGGNCNATFGPIFRSYPPNSSPKRTFPSLEYILNNANSPIANVGECLPSVARNLNFQFIAYDNNLNAGGTDIKNLTVTVENISPLQVITPNTNVNINAGSSYTVTWTNTTSSLSDSVNILLSVDGGITWPYTLAETPNDGSQSVTIPANTPGGTKARIRIESRKYSCFKFFDVSNVNFTIISPCAAISTIVSPTTNLITTLGNTNLNLGMINNLGSPLTAPYTGTISSGDNLGNLIFHNGTPAICSGPSNGTFYDLLPFSVDQAGSYTISHGGSGIVLNLYGNTFSGANCTNHIISSGTRTSGTGNVLLNGSFTAALTANTLYYLMISGFSGVPGSPNYSITFTKPSGATVYKDGLSPPANYSYTYIAVNRITNILTQQSATSNFTTLPSGTYDIYGVHYYSGSGTNPPTVNPTTWINQNFNTIKNSPTCIAISSNSRQVTIQDCILSVTSQAATGLGTLAGIMSAITPGCGVVFAPGIDTISLATSIDLPNNFTMDGTGQNVLINLTTNGAYVFKNLSTGSAVLKNIKIRHNSPISSSNVILNEGNLTLDGVSLIGNVNEALKNATTPAKVIVKNTVTIRKT